MKQNYAPNFKILLVSITLSISAISYAQVGIGNTNPNSNALLDVGTNTSIGGIRLPRVALSNTSSFLPLSAHVEGMVVYNTASSGSGATAVTPGFYYNDGSNWIRTSKNDDWKLKGNSGTNASSNFLGTTDDISLRFRTNNTERLEITNDGYIRAFANGSNSIPIFSWDSDTNTGIYHSNNDRLNFSAGGREFIELFEGSNDELRINDTGADINFRVESDDEANMFFIDGNNNNIGLGTNSPNTSAQLEMSNNSKGLLINRVSLTATNSASPISLPSDGLLVYNLASSSSGSTRVSPGFYYWDTDKWIAMDGTNGKDWSLEGNAGTNATNNFLGTIDNTTLVFRTNNSERMRVINDGRVSINNNNPYAGDRFTVTGNSDEYAINGYTSGAGVGVYGENTGTGDAMEGINLGTGNGVFGYGANSHGVFGYTTYTGGPFLTGGVIGWGAGANQANGVLAVADNLVSTGSNIGLRAVSGSTTSISTDEILNIGINSNATDLALYTITEGPITSLGTLEAARFQTNYTGSSIDADARDPRAQLAGYTNSSLVGGGDMYYGGYFYSGGSSSNSSYAYTGARYNNTNYKIIGNGAVSTIVESKDGKNKVMFSPEAPEVLFEDYGTGILSNGSIYINLDETLANNIIVDQNHPLKVFIQLEGECNGVYVSQKSLQGFLVKELKSGKSNVSFSWHIVANRKDVTNREANQNSLYSDLRFPDAPNSILIKENKEVKIKNANVNKYSSLKKK